jgi:hypothetical protein
VEEPDEGTVGRDAGCPVPGAFDTIARDFGRGLGCGSGGSLEAMGPIASWMLVEERD